MKDDKVLENRQLHINIISNILSWGTALAINFLVTPYIVNSLGKEIYSFYGLANNLVNYVAILSVAINSLAAKYITIELTRKNVRRASEYFVTILFSNICLSLACIPIFAYVVINISRIFHISEAYVEDVRILYILVFGTFVINILSSVFGASTYASNRVDLKAYSNILGNCIRVLMYFILFSLFSPSIVYMGVVALLVETYNLCIQIYFKKILMPEIKIKRLFLNLGLLWKMLKIGVWNSVNQMGDLLLSSSDMIASNLLLGETAGGSISLIKIFPSLVSGIITAINSPFLPRISVQYGKKNKTKMLKEVKNAQITVGMITVVCVMTIVIFGESFFSLWTPSSSPTELSILSSIDIIRMIIVGCVWPIVNLCTIIDKTKYPAVFICIIGGINIVAMIFLTDYIGINAIVITTTVLTFIYYGVCIPWYVSKELGVRWYEFYGAIRDAFFSCAILYIVGMWIKHSVRISSWFNFFLCILVFGVLAFLIVFMVYSHFKPKDMVKEMYK